MKRLNPRGIKILKMLHHFFVAVWIGAGVSLVVLMVAARPNTIAEAQMQARMLQIVDLGLVASFAFGLLLSGFLYSLVTPWGFTKYWWIIAKWILIVFQIVFGTFIVGPYIDRNLVMARNMTGKLTDYPQYFNNLNKACITGAAQLVLLAFVIVISVWKPWGRTRH